VGIQAPNSELLSQVMNLSQSRRIIREEAVKMARGRFSQEVQVWEMAVAQKHELQRLRGEFVLDGLTSLEKKVIRSINYDRCSHSSEQETLCCLESLVAEFRPLSVAIKAALKLCPEEGNASADYLYKLFNPQTK
jgi:hypothetical protein